MFSNEGVKHGTSNGIGKDQGHSSLWFIAILLMPTVISVNMWNDLKSFVEWMKDMSPFSVILILSESQSIFHGVSNKIETIKGVTGVIKEL